MCAFLYGHLTVLLYTNKNDMWYNDLRPDSELFNDMYSLIMLDSDDNYNRMLPQTLAILSWRKQAQKRPSCVLEIALLPAMG